MRLRSNPAPPRAFGVNPGLLWVPPRCGKGCGWAACQHLGSTGVAWESTSTTPGATRGTPRSNQGIPRGTPRLRQGTTKATPRQHPGNTRLTPWLHSGHGPIMRERHAGHAGRHPWLHPCRPRSQPGHTQATRRLHPIRTRVTSMQHTLTPGQYGGRAGGLRTPSYTRVIPG